MLSDHQASELISRSLSGRLSDDERAVIDEKLAQDPSSRAFAQLSALIQDSVAGIGQLAAAGDASVGGSLSLEAKSRLKESLSQAARRSGRLTVESAKTLPPPMTVHPDFALAAELVARGHLTPDTLAAVATRWDSRDVGSLGDYLADQGVVARETVHECQRLLATRTMTLGAASWETPGLESPALTPSRDLRISGGVESRTEQRQLVSRFTLLRKLGEGGLGSVWLARDEKLGRNVAIKEMNATAMESAQAWQRFQREAEITGHLEHPNVVPLYQFGTDPKTGNPFYAMRFLGKSTLADAIIEFHERRLAGEQDCVGFYRLLTAFQGVCQAIAYAHSRGVIHRDLKPENVALDSFGQVIVLDWGLAKLTDEAELRMPLGKGPATSDSHAAQTLAGEVIGTPLYMAPEQAAGNLEAVDERTDVYGLGAILFAILTGSAPHEKSHHASGGRKQVPELLRAIAENETPHPRELNPNVPAELEAICIKAMSRRSFSRYASVSDLADDVQAWMAGQNARRQQYEQIKLDGRDLRSALSTCIRDLGTNARFMSHLPPIQGLIDSQLGRESEALNVWRERLASIFKGLLQANSTFNAVSFLRVEGDEAHELVRVERHSTEYSTVRSVPLSRLRHEPAPGCIQRMLLHKPDEVYAGLLLSEPRGHSGAVATARLIAGVPVYDETTEEVFGVVLLEAELQRVVTQAMADRRTVSRELFVTNADGQVVASWTRNEGAGGRELTPIQQWVPQWAAVQTAMAEGQDYINDNARDLFATQLSLAPDRPGLGLILRA